MADDVQPAPDCSFCGEVRGAIFSTVDRSTGICGVCVGMFYEYLSLMAAADAEAREGKLLH